MSNSQPLIEKIIAELPEKDNAIVIVPSHRFKLFLASELNKQGKKIPYLFQLPELINQLSEGVLLAENPLMIQVALYKFLEDEGLWTTEEGNLPLFRRLAIITQIMKDIEELLLNLSPDEDVLKVIQNIENYYKTGVDFADDELNKHYLEILSNIWHLDQMTTTPPKQSLIFIAKLWELTGKFFLENNNIYRYTKKIWGVPIVTEGILLRKALENKQLAEDLIVKFNNPKVIVAGFSTLDTIYFELFKHLKESLHENITFIWEGGEWLEKLDNYILQPFLHNIRNSHLKNKFEKHSLLWQIKELNGTVISYPINRTPEVETHTVPNRTSQIGLLANMISQNENDESDNLRLILLLQKDIGSLLWHSFEKINLSLGLPLALTPLKSFLNLLDELRYFVNTENPLIPVNHYTKWKEHQIGKFLVKHNLQNDQDPSKTLFVDSNVWRQEVIDFLTTKGQKVISHFLNLLHYLDNQLSNDQKQNISRASVQQIAITLHLLQPILKDLKELDAGQIIQILRSILFSLQVHLKGEPLHGLQAMEILETRGLSFDEVFIPDVSETTLPPPERKLSMIPMSIRLFFGLPTPQIISFRNYYYLYRLLASTKRKIHFIIPSNMDGQDTQKSIVLSQIPIIFQGQKIKTTIYIPSVSLKSTDADLSFVKSLKQPNDSPLTLYVTELVDLIRCPRKFLLSKLIPKEIEEPYDLLGTDGRLIGDLVHNALAKIYNENKNLKSLIDNEDELTAILEEVFLELIESDTSSTNNIKTNFHLIPSFNISKKYVRNIIKRDYALLSQDGKEKILKIIHEYKIKFKELSNEFVIEGRIDRIETWESHIRIVDFKHGLSKNDSVNIQWDSIIEKIQEISKYLKGEVAHDGKQQLKTIDENKAYGLQIMIYKNLYKQNYPNQQDDKKQIKSYIYVISESSNENNSKFEQEVNIKKNRTIVSELEDEFMEHIFELAKIVSNQLREADATDLIKRFFPIEGDHCKYCQFRNICFIKNY